MASRTDTPDRGSSLSVAFSVLRWPVFRNVWIAITISSFGAVIQSVGAAWVMTSIASSHMVALVQAATTLPIMLLSLLAGAMADNYDRRKILLCTQGALFTVSVALAFCAWIGGLTPWLLLTFTFFVGCGAAFGGPAWQVAIADMVPRSQLTSAVALNGIGFNVARSVGPAIGGAIVATAGAATAFVVNAMSYVGMIGVLLRWKPQKNPERLPNEALSAAMNAGIRYVWMSPALRILIMRSIAFGLSAISVMALMPLVAKSSLAGGPIIYGLLLGAFGMGAVGGALVSVQVRAMLSSEGIVRAGSIGVAGAVAIAGLSSLLSLSMLALFAAGACWLLTLSTLSVSVQLSTPRWVVARAVALYQTAAFGSMAVGSLLWGVLAEKYSIRLSMSCAALALALSALLGRWLPLEQMEKLNLDPLRAWYSPDTVVPIENRSGPVVVTIEYRIGESDVLEFLRAMAERCRIRRRDGARQWILLRDLADPDVWVERYSVPTWIDYIRHNNRLTQEDADIPARLGKLHRGPHPPVVRRMIERQTSPSTAAELSTDVGQPLTDPIRTA